MGQDKALLPYEGTTVAEVLARRVEAVVGQAVFLGSPAKYGLMGRPVWPDIPRSEGPLTAICSALEQTSAEWNLFLAVDLPAVPEMALRQIVGIADGSDADAVVCEPAEHGMQPLCAAYRRRAAGPLRQAWLNGERAPRRAILELTVDVWTDPDPGWFVNCNTHREWLDFLHGGTEGRVSALH
jgi:molybdopterin-guanine dinucleotide biosynthesis protein A